MGCNYELIVSQSSSFISPLFLRQMDPKLRPSFPDIVRHLEEILVRLKVEEMEHECAPLSGDNNDKKTIAKGMCTEHEQNHACVAFPEKETDRKQCYPSNAAEMCL